MLQFKQQPLIKSNIKNNTALQRKPEKEVNKMMLYAKSCQMIYLVNR